MFLSRTDTIVAVASGFGRAGICVVRLSGPAAGAVLAACAGGLPPPRRASLRRLRDPATDETLDHALALWFPGPASFTGEDQAELHIHGGAAVRAAVLRVLLAHPGCRAAEPGEFTRRAFAHGRLDLTAAEGLADLIESETEMQRRQAQRQLDGVLAGRVLAWRERLVGALALQEASLDFADEGDIPPDVSNAALADVAALAGEVAAAISAGRRGERLRDGFTVVIAGPPNAGKSTLLNAIAQRDVAIVSPIPGTTRDAIELRCDLEGWPVVFVDTAGLRETSDPVEAQGIARTRARIDAADLVLVLRPLDGEDGVEVPGPVPTLLVGTKLDLISDPSALTTGHAAVETSASQAPDCLTEKELLRRRHAEERLRAASRSTHLGLVRASRRRSAAPQHDAVGSLRPHPGGDAEGMLPPKLDIPSMQWRVSAATGEGLTELLAEVRRRAEAALTGGADATLTRERHRQVLGDVHAALTRALEVAPTGATELVAEDLRLALRALGRMTGEVDVEEVLDRIFSSFCIGK